MTHDSNHEGFQFPRTKEEFESLRVTLEDDGFAVLTKWRKGLKTIRLGDIVLSDTHLKETKYERIRPHQF